MKSDLNRTKEFLDSLGILYGQQDRLDDDLAAHSLAFGKTNHGEDADGYPECDKIGGYSGFYTCLNFDENGKFLTVGVWE